VILQSLLKLTPLNKKQRKGIPWFLENYGEKVETGLRDLLESPGEE
jgi:hypothetical protein